MDSSGSATISACHTTYDKVDSFYAVWFCWSFSSKYLALSYFSSSSASTPETWAKFSHDNIYKAEREKLASINLRALIDNILHDISEDLRMQCAAVNEAFAKHVEELDDTKHKLEHHLKKVSVVFGMLVTGMIALFEKITVKLSSRKKILSPCKV